MGVWNAIECWFLQRLVLGIMSSVGTLALPLRPLSTDKEAEGVPYNHHTVQPTVIIFGNTESGKISCLYGHVTRNGLAIFP